jgi:hypothetical protein
MIVLAAVGENLFFLFSSSSPRIFLSLHIRKIRLFAFAPALFTGALE